MFLLCKLIKWGQGVAGDKDEGKMIFQAFFQRSLSLHLGPCSSAGWLINVTHSQCTAAGAAPWAHNRLPCTPIPPSLRVYGWKPILPPPPPGFPPLCLALCYDPGFPFTRSHFLTSAEGNASCLATLILFSWWSALISLPQQVSGPESKWTEKGKWCRTILRSYDMLNQCFFHMTWDI